MVRAFHVVLGLALAPLAAAQMADNREFNRRVAAALDKSQPILIEQLKAASMSRLALVCLAAVHDEVSPRNPVFANAIKRLERSRIRDTYGLSLRLMVMADFPAYPNRRMAAARDTRHLLACRRNGAFAYTKSGRNTDLSNTQYGALGMRAALALGCSVPMRCWKNLLRHVSARQKRDSSWSYSARRTEAGYSSMTVAGIAVLELCMLHGQLTQKQRAAASRRIKRAWGRMAKHQGDIGSTKATWCYYFHYGLERAAVLSQREVVGKTNWYRKGAEMLLREQHDTGGWGRGEARGPVDPVSTSFAILFLRRKFKRQPTGAVTPQGIRARYLPAQATPKQVTQSVELEVARGLNAVPDLLKVLRSKIQARRKAAALALNKLSGKSLPYDPYRNPAESEEAICVAERWWMTKGRLKAAK